jgi:hypothetical protein
MVDHALVMPSNIGVSHMKQDRVVGSVLFLHHEMWTVCRTVGILPWLPSHGVWLSTHGGHPDDGIPNRDGSKTLSASRSLS